MKIIKEQETSDRPIILCIDFDGTIVENAFPSIGSLRLEAKEYINKLHNDGYYIIIWTCRYLEKEVNAMITFLNENKIYYDKINENYPALPFKPYPKIYGDCYIDDRNLGGVLNWSTIYKYIKIYNFVR